MEVDPSIVYGCVLLLAIGALFFAQSHSANIRAFVADIRAMRKRVVYIHSNIRTWTDTKAPIALSNSENLEGMIPNYHHGWENEMVQTISYGWTSWATASRVGSEYILDLDGELTQLWSPRRPVLVVYDETTDKWHFGLFGAERADNTRPFAGYTSARFAGFISAAPLDDGSTSTN